MLLDDSGQVIFPKSSCFISHYMNTDFGEAGAGLMGANAVQFGHGRIET